MCFSLFQQPLRSLRLTSTNGLTGFAGQAKNGNGASKPSTTGGKNGQVIYINNLNDLKNQLGDLTPKILVIEKNISASSKTVVNIGSNKSLIGSYAQNKLVNIHLKTTSNSANVIFQNLTFEHSANINDNDNDDIQLYLTAGTNYWIDHVTFAGHNYDSNGSDLDKLLYVGLSADYVTISNSKFANHKYGLILGYPDDGNKSYDGLPHITIANNYFENLQVRGPGLMRYGYFHVENNYINICFFPFTVLFFINVCSETIHSSHSIFLVCKPQPFCGFFYCFRW